jgi:hypothetical protein
VRERSLETPPVDATLQSDGKVVIGELPLR